MSWLVTTTFYDTESTMTRSVTSKFDEPPVIVAVSTQDAIDRDESIKDFAVRGVWRELFEHEYVVIDPLD